MGGVWVAPAGTPLEEMQEKGTDLTPYLQPKREGKVSAMQAALVQLGWSAEDAARALGVFSDSVGSPKRELLWRLNEQVQQRDPGKPVHWRGLP